MVKKIVFQIIVIASLFSCNQSEEKKGPESDIKKDTAVTRSPAIVAKRPPIINITDTLSAKYTVLYIKDSAANVERIGLKLAEIYGFKLAAVINKNNLKTNGQPMAWYNSTKAPYFFEAGIPINKKPAKLPGNIHVKEIAVDSVVVAHFYGPYEMLNEAYDALNDWMKDHKKKIAGKPYEIYVDDPMEKDGKMKDPYKVRTDVIFTWK